MISINKKIYFIQPTYPDQNGNLLKGKKLYIVSLALPALSATVPDDWQKEFCYEYFEDVNFDTDASVVAISSMGYEIFRATELAKEFKKRGKKVILGGFQPSVSKNFISSDCDSIIHQNPGKSAMQKILLDVENDTLKKEYFCGVDLNYIMDYSVLETSRIFFTPVLFSIGCRNNCDYCVVGNTFGGKYYLRHLQHVKEELQYLHKFTRRIAVVDTNFYNNREFLIKICEYMIEQKFKFVWGAQCTIDIGNDLEVLTLLKKANCKVLFIGLETIEQQNLEEINKNYSVDLYHLMIKNIQDSGIKIAGFFIYGFDNDTNKTAEQMAEFIKHEDIALPMLNVLVPAPGTRIYEKLKTEGRILMKDELDFLKNNPEYNSSFNLCFYKPKNMTPTQIEEGFLDLLRRLSGLYQLIKRSLSKSLSLTLFLLYMNWLFRKEYYSLKKKKEQ